jgi:hypothetical protein
VQLAVVRRVAELDVSVEADQAAAAGRDDASPRESGDGACRAVERGIEVDSPSERPDPRPATEPVKVSLPCSWVRPVLQSMICSKFAAELPVRLPLY